jgi:hypothetical protein
MTRGLRQPLPCHSTTFALCGVCVSAPQLFGPGNVTNINATANLVVGPQVNQATIRDGRTNAIRECLAHLSCHCWAKPLQRLCQHPPPACLSPAAAPVALLLQSAMPASCTRT